MVFARWLWEALICRLRGLAMSPKRLRRRFQYADKLKVRDRPSSRLLGRLAPCDRAPLRRRLLRRAVHYRSAPRHPRPRWEPLALYVRLSPAPGPSVRIRVPIQAMPLSGPYPVHPSTPVWPAHIRIWTRPARNGRRWPPVRPLRCRTILGVTVPMPAEFSVRAPSFSGFVFIG